MGYTTWFDGEFVTDREMNEDLINKINKFAEERHCKGDDFPDVNDHSGYPGYWCNWKATSSTSIGWNDAEKFYNYDAWLVYIIEHFMKPNDIKLNGEVSWQGEDSEDFGLLIVEDNTVYVRYGIKEYGEKQLVK